MAAQGTVFKRNEKKYILTQSGYLNVLEALEPYMREDQYGLHTITSIYYDTEDFSLIRASMRKPEYKEKFRLRCYGQPAENDPVFLELKKKLDGIVYKRRISLPLWEGEAFLQEGCSIAGHGQIADEIEWFVREKHIAPRLLLAYDRIALFGRENPNLRITFDENIRFREEELSFMSGSGEASLTSRGQVLMEIKVNGAIPLWLSALLSSMCIYPNSFSKYGAWYQEHCNQEGLRHVG